MRRYKKKGPLGRYLSIQFCSNAATECRVIGAFVGLVSILLSWGSVRFDDGVDVHQVLASPLSLLSADLLLMAGSVVFIVATILTFIEAYAALGQIVGVVAILIGLPDHLAAITPPDWLIGPVTTSISGFGWGTILAIVSIALVIASMAIGGRIGRYRDKEEEDINVHRSGMNDPFSFGGGNIRP